MSFKEEFERGLEESLNKLFPETPKSAIPELSSSVGQLAKKAGLETPKICVISPRARQSHPKFIAMRGTFAAMPAGKPRVILGDIGLERLTGNAEGKIVTRELEAVIAHELAHLKYDRGFVKALASQNLPAIGAIAGIGSYMIYKHYSQSAKYTDQFRQHLQASEQNETDNVISYMPEDKQLAYRLAENIAALALGFGVGLIGKKEINFFREYRADRFSAELLQDAQPLITFFKRFESNIGTTQLMKQSLKNDFENLGMDDRAVRKFYQKESLFDKFVHPEIKDRISRLESLQFPAR